MDVLKIQKYNRSYGEAMAGHQVASDMPSDRQDVPCLEESKVAQVVTDNRSGFIQILIQQPSDSINHEGNGRGVASLRRGSV